MNNALAICTSQGPSASLQMLIQVLAHFSLLGMLLVNRAPLCTKTADFHNQRETPGVLVTVESRRSSFVSCNVVFILDRPVEVLNSFWLSPTTSFSVLTALWFADVASSLVLVPLSLTPKMKEYSSVVR